MGENALGIAGDISHHRVDLGDGQGKTHDSQPALNPETVPNRSPFTPFIGPKPSVADVRVIK
jgi:hypothetical protein